MRRIAYCVIALALLVAGAAPPTRAETIKIGLLKTSSSAVTVIAIKRGYFTAEGLDAQLVPFDAAEPVAVATASGDIDFGITGLTAGLYALASQLRIVSGHLQEHPGFHANAIVASNKAYDAGLKTVKDLAGHSVGVTQIGSSLHYSVALVAEKSGIALDGLRIVPLQSNANVASAVSGGQIDAAATLGNFASPAIERGAVKLLAWAGDIAPWQFGALITSAKMASDHPDTVKRFLNAMHKAQHDYHDAFTAPDGNAPGPGRCAGDLRDHFRLYRPDGRAASAGSRLCRRAGPDRCRRCDASDRVVPRPWLHQERGRAPSRSSTGASWCR